VRRAALLLLVALPVASDEPPALDAAAAERILEAQRHGGLLQEDAHYFDWHHTPADTFDKVDPRALAESAAFFAIVAYALAEDPETLPRPEPPANPEP
jgi:hypothetical protein